jgi:hypothetical protein
MKINFKKVWVIAKINFSHLKLAYIITVVTVLAGTSNLIQYLVSPINDLYVDSANYLYLTVILASIFIPALNFKKIMHLNGKKLDYYLGTLMNYIIIAAAVSLLNIVLYSLCQTIFGSRLIVMNTVQLFGWYDHGFAVAFFQQFFFLLLAAIFIHTLTMMQTFWFGWVTDLVLIAIISVFTPIPVLRSALVRFFSLIVYNSNAPVQIVSCLVLTAGIYALCLPVLQRKKI